MHTAFLQLFDYRHSFPPFFTDYLLELLLLRTYVPNTALKNYHTFFFLFLVEDRTHRLFTYRNTPLTIFLNYQWERKKISLSLLGFVHAYIFFKRSLKVYFHPAIHLTNISENLCVVLNPEGLQVLCLPSFKTVGRAQSHQY